MMAGLLLRAPKIYPLMGRVRDGRVVLTTHPIITMRFRKTIVLSKSVSVLTQLQQVFFPYGFIKTAHCIKDFLVTLMRLGRVMQVTTFHQEESLSQATCLV